MANIFGASGLEFSFGVVGGTTKSEQKHLNALRNRANSRGSISTGELSSAWEGGLFIEWKGPIFGLQLRPTYFTQSEDGTGGTAPDNGTYKYATSGQTFGALFKLYPLSNKDMRMYLQTGIVWGSLKTEIQEATYNAKASGSNLGYQIGAGFDLLWGAHKVFLEVGWRYLNIETNIVDSTSGTPASDSVSQTTKNNELEFDNKNLSTNMSGTQLFLGYGYSF
jgi:hypothetical protein